MIVSLHLPFRAVENPYWRDLCKLQNPKFLLPSARTIRRRLDDHLEQWETSVLADLPKSGKVSLSLDCWSSSTRMSFMAIKAHYITDDWKLAEELIGFEPLTGVHSGQELASVVNNILEKRKLSERVISITTDNASSNGTMVSELNSYLKEAIENQRFLDGKVIQMPCLAHVIQLAVKALLGKIRLRPTNDNFIAVWQEQQDLDDLNRIQKESKHGIPWIFAKVCSTLLYTNLHTDPL